MATITSVVTKSEDTSSLEQIPCDILFPIDTQVQIKMERGENGVEEDVGELQHAECSSHEGTGTTFVNSARESGTRGPDFVENVCIKQETEDPYEVLPKLEFPVISGNEMREAETDMAHCVVDSAGTSQDRMLSRNIENPLEHAQTSSGTCGPNVCIKQETNDADEEMREAEADMTHCMVDSAGTSQDRMLSQGTENPQEHAQTSSDASSLLKTVGLPEELFMPDNEVELLDSDEGLMEMMYDLSICTFCNRKFKYASRLRKHMIIHSSERKFKCNECGASFKVKSTLKSHELTHSLDKPFMCDVCFSTHCTKSGLAKHIESKHGTGERRFICEICGKMFLLKTVLNKHIEYHNAKKVLCTVCGMLFHTESYLKKHVARVHEFSVKKPEQKFECSHCARSFSSKRPLRFHMMTVHLKETPFQCLICDMKFPVKYKLDSHMVCHTEGKFKCMCGRSFTTKPSMERHSLTHINYRPYTCDWCGLTFTQKSSVERHIVVNMRGHYKRTGTCKPIRGGRGGYYMSDR